MSATSSRSPHGLVRGLSAVLVLASLVLATSAFAETKEERQQRARELYQEGQRHADNGRWQQATEAWLEAYEAQPLPLILFNVAQAYRQMDDCPAALYFYKRYLRDEPDSQFSEVAEGHIATLATKCDPASPWDQAEEEEAGEPEPEEDPEPAPEPEPQREPQPQPVSEPAGPAEPVAAPTVTAFAEGGPAIAPMGELTVPVFAAFRAGVGYPLDAGVVEVQPGAVATFMPVPWTGDNDTSGTALLTGLVANAAARYPIAAVDGLFARGELGLGVLIFSGIAGENSVFMADGQTATGALSMFHLRAQVAAEYEITPNFALSVSPIAFSYSPARTGLRDDIGSLTRFEALAGALVRL